MLFWDVVLAPACLARCRGPQWPPAVRLGGYAGPLQYTYVDMDGDVNVALAQNALGRYLHPSA